MPCQIKGFKKALSKYLFKDVIIIELGDKAPD